MYRAGSTHEMSWIVTKDHLASAFGSGLMDVLATPVLIGFCEEASRAMIDAHLPEGQNTVGTAVSLTHIAATPLGMRVTIRSTLKAIEGRQLTFDVQCEDEVEPIGHCTHTRFIIDSARFEAGIASKSALLGSGQESTKTH